MANTWGRVPARTATPRARTREQLLAELESQERGYASQGARASDAYLDQATNFDATEALNTYTQGAWNTIGGQLKRSIADERGRSVGAGRLDTGFYDEDVGDLYRGATDQLTNAVASQSMNALSATQRNTESLGQYGQNMSERATGMTQGMWEVRENDDREEREAKRRRKRGIGAALGAVAGGVGGFLIGGPGGAYKGATIGSSIGGGF